MTVKHDVDKIECAFDGAPLLEATDDSFLQSGAIGVWTAANAQTHFDGLKVTDFGPAAPPRQRWP